MKRHGLVLLGIAILGGLLALGLVLVLKWGRPNNAYSYDLGSGESICRSYVYGLKWRTLRRPGSFRLAYEKYLGHPPQQGAEQLLGAGPQSPFADPWAGHFDKYGNGAGLLEHVGAACLGQQSKTSLLPPPEIEEGAKAALLEYARGQAAAGKKSAISCHVKLARLMNKCQTQKQLLDRQALLAEGLLGSGSRNQ
ncbi:hypothetical protein IT575_04690 [bacterium]|nr:hypothetical protein [bacterium]